MSVNPAITGRERIRVPERKDAMDWSIVGTNPSYRLE